MNQYTSHKYKFEVTLFGEKFDDVGAFTVFRCPISHTASYSILNIQLRGLIYLTINTEVENGNFPDISIKCSLLDTLEHKTPADFGKEKEILFTKRYKVLKVTTHEYPNPNSTYLNCTLVLVNPVLLYLGSTNSYNKILMGKTGLQIIENFESHIQGIFGSCFEFKKIGENIEKNNFAYEQILVRLENDLMIPSWAIANYKPNMTYSFYFFDDFRIDSSSKKDITAYYINMGAKDQFAKKSILQNANDVFMGNKFVKSWQIGDPFNAMNQINPSVMVKTNELGFSYYKAKGETPIPAITQNSNGINIDGRSLSTIQTSQSTTKNVKPTEQTIVYSPDTGDNGKKRLDLNSKLLKTDLSGFASFLLKDSHFDYIQFGINYILNPFESKEYRYTPINIVNHFIRESGSYPHLIHHCQYQTIKFKATKDWV